MQIYSYNTELINEVKNYAPISYMFVVPIELNMLATQQVRKGLVKNPYHQIVGSRSIIY